jgi:hypothetical protein
MVVAVVGLPQHKQRAQMVDLVVAVEEFLVRQQVEMETHQ